MEPTETICDLAARYLEEDASEAQRCRFALKLDGFSRQTGIPRSRVFLLWKGEGLPAARRAAA